MSDFWNIHELVAAARAQLEPGAWDFIVGGSETETTLRRNRSAIDAVALRPRVLRDVSNVDCTRDILGKRHRLPLLLAPIGNQTYGGGPQAAAAAAKAFGCGYMFSSVNAQSTIEEIAALGPPAAVTYQLYVRGDDDWVKAQVDRAVAVGCTAFCVTVDTPVISRRERDFANRYTSDRRRHFDGAVMQASFDWRKLELLRACCPLPLIVKGIQDSEDARRATELGVDTIYLSNHGGRQQDHVLGTLELLPEIVDAAAPHAKVIVDGAMLRGSDIAKAIALGAEQVGIGKLFCLALAAAGEAGVIRLLELLEDELIVCMSLTGVATLDELDRSWVRPARIEPAEQDFLRGLPLLARTAD
jgi:glycolate oxidase